MKQAITIVGVLQVKDTYEPIYRVNGEYTVKVSGERNKIVGKTWSVFCTRLRDYYLANFNLV